MAKQEFVFGQHAVSALLATDFDRVIEVFIVKTRHDEKTNKLVNSARAQGIPVHFCHKKTLDEKAKGQQHQGVIAKARSLPIKSENDLEDIVKRRIDAGQLVTLLILDGITDPHNLGACLRTADAAGVDAVIVPRDKSAGLSPTVKKVACGAAEVLPLIQVTNLVRTIKSLQALGVWVIGTAGEAKLRIFEISLNGNIALVMGAEEKGMRRLTRETCDELAMLPMAGSVSSLNVSVAAGICLFEVVRQRSINH